MRIEWLRPLLVALTALLLAAAGVWLLAGAGGNARRVHVVVDGIPLDEVHPPAASGDPGAASGDGGGSGKRPGVVVAHGFAGSAELMAPFGDSLAARGYVVVLLDFSGHGANTHRLRAGDEGQLQGDLAVAVAHLRALPDVDPGRISLVGHSMGAGAVTRYAAGHDDIAATVAISLPDASEVRPGHPARLLALVGGLEFPSFRSEAERAGRSVVPGVDHISILFSGRAHRETADFLDGAPGGPLPSPARRAGGAALLLVALAAGVVPLAKLLLGPAKRWPSESGPGQGGPERKGRGRGALLRVDWRDAGAAAGAGVVAAVVAWVLPVTRLPLAVGGYVVGLTAVMGALLLAYASRRRRTVKEAGGKRLAATLLIPYAAISVAVPLQLGLTHVVPVGARWWLLPVVWAGFAIVGYAAERTAGVLIVSAVVVVALAGAAVTGLTSTFVLLVAPLLAVLMVWQAVWGVVLRRFGAPRWVIAMAGSLLVAWPIATTLPLVSP